MFTICGQHVVLEVKSVKLLQMGNVIYQDPLNFVVLPTESHTHKPQWINRNINDKKNWQHISSCWGILQTCRESWRVCSDKPVGNSMRSTPAQSTAHSAVQLHSEGHSIASYFLSTVAVFSSSLLSSSAVLTVGEIPITKVSTVMVFRTEHLAEAILMH